MTDNLHTYTYAYTCSLAAAAPNLALVAFLSDMGIGIQAGIVVIHFHVKNA